MAELFLRVVTKDVLLAGCGAFDDMRPGRDNDWAGSKWHLPRKGREPKVTLNYPQNIKEK